MEPSCVNTSISHPTRFRFHHSQFTAFIWHSICNYKREKASGIRSDCCQSHTTLNSMNQSRLNRFFFSFNIFFWNDIRRKKNNFQLTLGVWCQFDWSFSTVAIHEWLIQLKLIKFINLFHRLYFFFCFL